MSQCLVVASVSLTSLFLAGISQVRADEFVVLENDWLGLRFDRAAGNLTALENKLTGETHQVSGDEFLVEADGFRVDFADVKLASLEHQNESLRARYRGKGMTVEATYTLHRERHFAEKQMVVTCERDYGLKKLIVSRASFAAADLKIVEYRYPKFKRSPGTEPSCTFFGRTPRGGFFTGVEEPFDASTLSGNQVVLAYAPSLKMAAGEKLESEPVYWGVYRRGPRDQEKPTLPLQSESDAMVAMTSTILGAPRHGLVPMACGWHSEMEHCTYTLRETVSGDMRSLDFLAECGIDWLSDCHPWGGETEKMNALVGNQKYVPGPLVCKFLEHAQKLDVKIVMWSSMNNTHPWWGKGKPFRPDKPEWIMTPRLKADTPNPIKRAKANCLANRPFLQWLTRINRQGLATGYYKAWAMDGSFFGDGGWYTTIIPVTCLSNKHDHLPGDSNYACQRALAQLMASVRQAHPDIYIFTCRPPMDLGVWSLENVDACFTLLESGTGNSNIASGDHIRTWSRIRVHHDFLPHYIDQPLVFPSRAGGPQRPPNWPSGHLDYILLSALSTSPNQLYYMPTKSGIPDEDKAEIRKWLDWGRKNIDYIMVRKDLPDWPAAGKVDGSAHICNDRGFVFLFNPNKNPLHGEFKLTEQSIGLKGKGAFKVTQDYPESDRNAKVLHGETVCWEVPGETAVVLMVQPLD